MNSVFVCLITSDVGRKGAEMQIITWNFFSTLESDSTPWHKCLDLGSEDQRSRIAVTIKE